MASAGDIAGIQQSGVAILSELQETMAKTVPTNSSGHLAASTLIQSGFVRVLGVSIMAGSGGTSYLHDCATLADASGTNRIYLVSNTPGYSPVNLVFHKGLVFIEGGTGEVAIMYTRV